jgi:hypothetical protein
MFHHRWLEGGSGDDVVIANFSNETFRDYAFGVPHPGMRHARLNSDWEGYSKDFIKFPTIDAAATEDPLHSQPCRVVEISIGRILRTKSGGEVLTFLDGGPSVNWMVELGAKVMNLLTKRPKVANIVSAQRLIE